MLIDKYNRILIDKLPASVATEVEQIKTDTDNFSDTDLIDIYKDNFNDLFDIIKTKYPEALKPKKKLIIKTKAKLVKKAQSKKKLIKKLEPKKKIDKIAWERKVIDLLAEKFAATNSDAQGLFEAQAGMFDASYKKGLSPKQVVESYGGQSNSGPTKDKIDRLLNSKTDLNNIIQINDFNKAINTIQNNIGQMDGGVASHHFSNFDEKDWDTKSNRKEIIENYLKTELMYVEFGSEFMESNDKGALKTYKEKDPNCEEAVEIIHTQQKKKEEAAKKRAEAPKKKASTAVREKQVKAIKSALKTNALKNKTEEIKEFSNDIISVYKKHNFAPAFLSALKEDIDTILKNKKVEKMTKGGQLEGEGVNLFEDYENIPKNVQDILDEHAEAFEDGDYKELEKALKELNKIGYTFEYGLDGGAYDLRKIGQKGKSEQQG